ncbi:putative small nuclear ribonucleoprotein SmD3 [Aspergillus lucknowensis]|uniref:Small nuclear ribonucleoprotein Sm D3 n=1 Tax=Aspergillus lucknowensis TaxID=176173 RepID=A0ABR4M208_9EURO
MSWRKLRLKTNSSSEEQSPPPSQLPLPSHLELRLTELPFLLFFLFSVRSLCATLPNANMGKLTSTIGIPIKLLNEAQGHVVTLEITSGVVYRGKLLEAEDNMNVQLKDITVTARDGRVSHLDQVYIRGSHVRFFIVPDMLRNAPMFRSRGQRGRGVGLARGKATVQRARGQRRG